MAEHCEWLFVHVIWLGAYLKEQTFWFLNVVEYLYVN